MEFQGIFLIVSKKQNVTFGQRGHMDNYILIDATCRSTGLNPLLAFLERKQETRLNYAYTRGQEGQVKITQLGHFQPGHLTTIASPHYWSPGFASWIDWLDGLNPICGPDCWPLPYPIQTFSLQCPIQSTASDQWYFPLKVMKDHNPKQCDGLGYKE